MADEKDRVARDDISREQAPEYSPVIFRNGPRNADAFWNSRHIAQPASPNVVIDFAQHIVELAARDIALHLLIPLVIFPAVQPSSEFSALFERKLFDGFFDLFDAHVGNLGRRHDVAIV